MYYPKLTIQTNKYFLSIKFHSIWVDNDKKGRLRIYKNGFSSYLKKDKRTIFYIGFGWRQRKNGTK